MVRYGYKNENNHHGSYTFTKQQLEVYPYSQHDIPPSQDYQQQQHHLHYLRNYPTALTDSDPHYYEKQAKHERLHTTVEIQPSHSYEIKQTANGYRTIYNGEDNSHGYHQEHEEESPVIVLRIPGPPKYASHLRSLLQQYLEVCLTRKILFQLILKRDDHLILFCRQIEIRS